MLSASAAAALSVRHSAVSRLSAAVAYFLTLWGGLISPGTEVASHH